MPANVYECMFLLDNNKVAGDLPAVVKVLHATLEKHNAEILASRSWGEHKLAYPVKGQKKGLYYLTYFRTEGKNIAGLEHDLALNESLLRNLILKIDPKYVEVMLAVARDERALAYQAAHDSGSDDLGGGGGDDRGGRRGRREERDKEE